MRQNAKQLILLFTFLGIFAFYIAHRATKLFLTLSGDLIPKLNQTIDGTIAYLINEPIDFQFTQMSLITGGIVFSCCLLIGLYIASSQKNYRPGEEYGSARWGTAKDSAPFKAKKKEQNILLTETESLTMETRLPKKKRKYERNKNILIVGGAGSGKTLGFVKPNLMQLHSSYVVTESKNLLPHETGKMLVDAGYKIKVFDLVNRAKCDYFNPLAYVDSEDRVLMIVNNLMKNTDNRIQKSGDPFWEKAETALYCAIISYLKAVGRPEEQTLTMVGKLLREGRIDSDDEKLISSLDVLFEDFRKEYPDHFATRQYDTFKLATFKTARSILICASVRMMPFDIPSIEKLVSKDTLDLDKIGDEKTVLFVCLPDTYETYNFIAAMMYEILFEVLVYKADNLYHGRLPIHVRCILDEFANIGQIPSFDKKVTTIRSREISVSILLQNLAQLKNLYKHTWENITGSCDTFLYLGGMEETSQKRVSQLVGKETIDILKYSQSYGGQGSYSKSADKTGRDLINQDEVANLDNDYSILKIRGVPAFKSKKYNARKHRNYKLLSDTNPDNWYEYNVSLRPMEEFLRNVKIVETYAYQEINQLVNEGER
ncbi:VirD4-like conjugal transfer protein, CD1115 family [Enterococcus olivae]